eukprot:763658-Hanusia_phi.AAC.2
MARTSSACGCASSARKTDMPQEPVDSARLHAGAYGIIGVLIIINAALELLSCDRQSQVNETYVGVGIVRQLFRLTSPSPAAARARTLHLLYTGREEREQLTEVLLLEDHCLETFSEQKTKTGREGEEMKKRGME